MMRLVIIWLAVFFVAAGMLGQLADVAKGNLFAAIVAGMAGLGLVGLIGLQRGMRVHRDRSEARRPELATARHRRGFLAYLVGAVLCGALTGWLIKELRSHAGDSGAIFGFVFASMAAVGTLRCAWGAVASFFTARR